MVHSMRIPAKRHMIQIALNAHTGIVDVAAAYRIANIIQSIPPQVQRQIAHHLLGAGLLQNALQIEHAREALLCHCAFIGFPGHANRTTRIGIGKLYFRQGHMDLLPLFAPLHFGLKFVEVKARLLKNTRKFCASLVQVQVHAPAGLAEIKVDLRALQPGRSNTGPVVQLSRRTRMRQPANLAGFAAHRIRIRSIQLSLPCQIQFLDLSLWLVPLEGPEHGIAQWQPPGQLTDDANVPVITLDFSATGSRIGCIVVVHAHVSARPTQIVVSDK